MQTSAPPTVPAGTTGAWLTSQIRDPRAKFNDFVPAIFPAMTQGQWDDIRAETHQLLGDTTSGLAIDPPPPPA